MASYRVPFRAGRVIAGVGAAAAAGAVGTYVYRRFVMLDTFKVVRDDSGAWRWQTRLEHINERLAASLKALQAAPTDSRLGYEAAVWLAAKQQEEAALKAAGRHDDAITDDDLNS